VHSAGDGGGASAGAGGGAAGAGGAAGHGGTAGGGGAGGRDGGPATDAASDAGTTGCGSAVCAAGDYCCNVSCNLCAPVGAACIQIACGPDAAIIGDAGACVALSIGNVTNTFCCP
jgi:hypothetical protein